MKRFFLLGLALTGLAAAAAEGVLVSGPLTMDNEAISLTGELSGRVAPRSGATWPVSTTRPAGVVKEPPYRGTPYYGVVRIGNGPRAETHFVMDFAPADRRADNRLYFDRNHNGDLTDDGDGVMQSVGKNLPGARVGPHFDVVPASWVVDGRETHADYGLMFLFGADRTGDSLSMITRTAATRRGTIDVGGRPLQVVLVETEGKGNFEIATAVPATRENFGDRTIRTMLLLLDVNGDGAFGALEVFDACLPVGVNGATYMAGSPIDGSRLTLTPTDRPAQVVTAPVRAAPAKDSGLLARGVAAPDFVVTDLGGREHRLSDYRGKIVVLDFWATWCIPCIRSMPHVQKTIEKANGGADIVWLGVCVWDDLPSFKRWVPLNDKKYNFTKVFDPAGKDKAASIASKLYKVTGIPTLYVIDREGRVVDGMTGYLGDDDHRLGEALGRLAAPAR